MHRFVKIAGAAVSALALALGATACEDGETDTATKERTIRNGGYDTLAGKQPAKTMQYSPTRETINFWVDTWNKPGKLSYVYLQNSEGKLIGYYVLKGLPVSYCSANTPNYEIWEDPDENGALLLPAPGLDGTYEASGAACTTYYGQDATTGAYIEYTVGLGINVLLYDQPLPQHNNVPPLGPTK